MDSGIHVIRDLSQGFASRGDAIASGALVDLSGLFPDVCERHYPGFGVACSALVWQRIEQATEAPYLFNDLPGVVSQVLSASRLAQVSEVDDFTRIFLVLLATFGRAEHLRLHWAPGDRDEPTVTITLPEEV